MNTQIFFVLFLVIVGCQTDDKPGELDQPNIVIIYADDLGWMDLSFQGSDYYESPNIDRIAREGMSFTRGYSNAGNCAPSRASLMTGMYTPRHKIYTVHTAFRGKPENRQLVPIETKRVLDTSFLTLPGFLKSKGYSTCIAGKWHLSSNASDYDFDTNFGGHQSGGPKSYFSPYKNPQLKDGPDGEHLPDRLSSDVSHWIKENKDNPFFVYFPFYSVHTPIQADSSLTAYFDAKEKGTLHDHAKYAAMIKALDEGVGRILSTLDSLDLTDDTFVLFTSDNGGYGPVTSQRPLRGAKGQHYEGGIRVPFFVRWPGRVEPGTRSDVPVMGADVFPTIADLVGGEQLPTFDGESILPLLHGESIPKRSLHWHFPCYLEMYKGDRAFEDSRDKPFWRSSPMGAMQKDDWKLIEYFDNGELQLYNLKDDQGEQVNLASEKPALVRSLHQEMKDWRSEVGADVPTERNAEYISK